MQHGCKVHFLKHVEVVIARRAVRTESNADAFRKKARHGSDATRELHVAAGIVRDTDAVLLDDGNIFVVKMHAVRRQCAVVEKTCGGDVCKGTLAVLFEAVLHLAIRF